jgi:hypothetical protein
MHDVQKACLRSVVGALHNQRIEGLGAPSTKRIMGLGLSPRPHSAGVCRTSHASRDEKNAPAYTGDRGGLYAGASVAGWGDQDNHTMTHVIWLRYRGNPERLIQRR